MLPRCLLPLAVEDLSSTVREGLSESELSIHLLGSRYGARPENEDRSIADVQLDLASESAARGELQQLIWIPDTLTTVDEEQDALVTALQSANIGTGVEVVRGPLESFKAHVLDVLCPRTRPRSRGHEGRRVYLVHDRDDREAIGPLQAELERLGHVVVLPLREGSEAEAREVHETSMVLCDAVLIFYGTASEHWVRMKLFDILKAPGWGRRRPFDATAVWVAGPATPSKAGYETDEALVLDATAGFTPEVLAPFAARLAATAAGR